MIRPLQQYFCFKYQYFSFRVERCFPSTQMVVFAYPTFCFSCIFSLAFCYSASDPGHGVDAMQGVCWRVAKFITCLLCHLYYPGSPVRVHTQPPGRVHTYPASEQWSTCLVPVRGTDQTPAQSRRKVARGLHSLSVTTSSRGSPPPPRPAYLMHWLGLYRRKLGRATRPWPNIFIHV